MIAAIPRIGKQKRHVNIDRANQLGGGKAIGMIIVGAFQREQKRKSKNFLKWQESSQCMYRKRTVFLPVQGILFRDISVFDRDSLGEV